MATIALQAVGNAALPGVGGIAGAMIGQYIDQNFLLPALFPEDDIQGPRVDSLQLGFASEGAPINFCIGPQNKPVGTVIWMSPIREELADMDVGGKGGGKSIEVSEFYVDIAILIADGSHLAAGYNAGTAATMCVEIWADGNLFYDRDADVNIASTSSDMSVTKLEFKENPDSPSLVTRVEMEIQSDNGGPDLTQLRSGVDVTVAGWTNGGNNGTFRLITARLDSVTGETFAILENVLAVTEVASASNKTVAQDNEQFAKDAADTITFYPGSFTQTADPTIVSIDGVINTTAYRGSAYFVIKNLALNAFGQRPPNTWEIKFQAQASVNHREVFKQILERSGRIEGTDFDVSGVSNVNVLEGYIVRGPRKTSEQLQQLMIAYDILHQERGGMMYFFDRASAVSTVIVASDMASHALGSDAARTVLWRPIPGLDLPKEINLSYIDPAADLQQGEQKYKRLRTAVGVAGTQVLSYRLDLVLTTQEAMCIAKRILWTAWLNRAKMSISLPPSYLAIIENDRLTITDDEGETRTVLAETVDVGYNGIHAIDGWEEGSIVLDFDPATDCPVEPPEIPTQKIYSPPELEFHVLDIAPLQDAHATSPTLYWVTAARDSTALFVGATLFESADAGTTYAFKSSISVEATMGITQSELADPAEFTTWDRTSKIEVELFQGAGFDSKTEELVLNGANFLIVGSELINFSTAFFNAGTGYWELTDLLRGQRGTEDEVTRHAPNDRVVLLSLGTSAQIPMNLSSKNSTRLYKSVPAEGDEADFTEKTLVIALNSLRPFSPAHAQGARDVSDNLTITFERRTRLLYATFSGTAPQVDSVLVFEVDVLTAPGGTVLRTITLVASANGSVITLGSDYSTALYDADDQTADGLTPGNDVNVNIYQISQSVGRSKGLAATI